MSACEKCWADAYVLSRFVSGRSQVDEYYRLLAQRIDIPCTPEQAAGPEGEPTP